MAFYVSVRNLNLSLMLVQQTLYQLSCLPNPSSGPFNCMILEVCRRPGVKLHCCLVETHFLCMLSKGLPTRNLTGRKIGLRTESYGAQTLRLEQNQCSSSPCSLHALSQAPVAGLGMCGLLCFGSSFPRTG